MPPHRRSDRLSKMRIHPPKEARDRLSGTGSEADPGRVAGRSTRQADGGTPHEGEPLPSSLAALPLLVPVFAETGTPWRRRESFAARAHAWFAATIDSGDR